ncbi:uncharacterized protein LOC108914089 [Anoplophora glabripennis]|uniref:uncharacterized protein LOC108914089 n=1 Tax=Anoplophora glabripennis TaxID=217634 RepID=UPI0008751CBB|nr:uncharacterized protein LOC108914089 [Anoplophora glabripennis]
MAYSLYEETQLNSPKSVQYYPEEYDYSSYYQKISEAKVNSSADHSTKKTKKATSSINYVNEKKCPIYVHQYNNIQNASTYNNYSYKAATKSPLEKNYSTKTKKIPGFPTTKSVLDQLEETYWATWKPNKENGTMSKKNKVQDNRSGKMKPYGDVPDNIAHYFTSSECDTTDLSTMEESDYEKYNKYETVMNMHDVCEKISVRPKTTQTQEIQTDSIASNLPKIEERVENDDGRKKEQTEAKEESADKKSVKKDISTEKSSDEDPEDATNKDKSKLLKHTDSFIINKKKQGEVKERFQQPKCIRLYRKPGISTSSFIRGGSYPLKSCLKHEPVPKGNFRLGAPGSPLFVSTSSFHRKSRK